MIISVIYSCCFKRCYESVSYVQSYRFCLYLVFVSAIRYMPCLLVSLIQSSCFIRCRLYVSIVQSCCFTWCLMFIAVMRYMSCLTVMLHISCFHVFNNHMLHMIIGHMFHIVMDMFDIMISMVNNLLYVIIITLICGIKMTWKLPNILTVFFYLFFSHCVVLNLTFCLFFPFSLAFSPAPRWWPRHALQR
jgi:hypothetical protein